MGTAENRMQLAHWRRTVAEMYANIRNEKDCQTAWQSFRNTRDDLFLNHPQSPLYATQKTNFSGLDYYEYNPDFAVEGQLDSVTSYTQYEVVLPKDGRFCFTRIAKVRFVINKHPLALDLYWVDGYGGGLFLPFRDMTNKTTTYGGGRYLYDAIKGADLGAKEATILLDFNYAYNPSCAYNDQWVCPLAPQENWLEFEIEAGEKTFPVTDNG